MHFDALDASSLERDAPTHTAAPKPGVADSRAPRPLRWISLFVWAAIFGMLALAAGIGAATSIDGRPVLSILLASNASLMFGAALGVRRAQEPVLTPRIDIGAKLLIASSSALCLLLLVRLAAVSQFGGNVANFDFGTKCSTTKGCSSNLAFEPNGNSVGHCVQGCSVFFLFPVSGSVIHYMFRRWRGLQRCLVYAKEIGALGLIVYPVYNVIKRAYKSADTFAASSFCNNGSEWAVGFLLGISLTFLCMAWVDHDPNSVDNGLLVPFTRAMLFARVAAGILFSVSTVVAAVLFGMSWDKVPEQNHTYDEDALALIALLSCPVIVAGISGLGLHKWALSQAAGSTSRA